jgi:hypothetical protein
MPASCSPFSVRWALLIWLGAITAIGWVIAITAGYSTVLVSHRNQS